MYNLRRKVIRRMFKKQYGITITRAQFEDFRYFVFCSSEFPVEKTYEHDCYAGRCEGRASVSFEEFCFDAYGYNAISAWKSGKTLEQEVIAERDMYLEEIQEEYTTIAVECFLEQKAQDPEPFGIKDLPF